MTKIIDKTSKYSNYRKKANDPNAVIKRMLYYLGKNKLLLILVFIAVTISTVINLFGTYSIRFVIDMLEEGLQAGSYESIANKFHTFLIVLLGAYLLGVILTFFQSRMMIKISQITIANIRKDAFYKLMRFPLSYYDKHSKGDTMSRFTNDLDVISEALNQSLVQILISVYMLVGVLLLMTTLSFTLMIVSAIMLPLLSLMVSQIAKRSRKYFSQQQYAIGSINGYIEEMIHGQKIVQIFHHEEEAMEEFTKRNQLYREKSIRAQSFSGMMIPLLGNINSINYAMVATVGGFLLLAGNISMGSIAAFLNLTRQFGRPLNEIANQFTTIQSGLAAGERIFELIDTKEEDDRGVELEHIEGHVRLEDVTFGYDPNVPVLHGISLYAKPGQKIALVGSTGAGKTTITNLLNRFYQFQSGSIYIDDVSLVDIKPSFIRAQMAMVLQDTHLFTGTIMENIRYGRMDATDEECIAAAKLSNAHSFIRHLEKGYQSRVSGDGSELSQGQRQLINIARAAVANPKILILDEATSSIDTRTERLIEKGMDELMKGRTTFVIAHRLSTVRNADAIMVMEHGQIIERGTHEDLLNQKGRYYALYTGQSELN